MGDKLPVFCQAGLAAKNTTMRYKSVDVTICRLTGKRWMRLAMALSILIPGALLLGCGDTPDEESHNIAAILSPDGSQVAFSRNFRYPLR